MIRKVMICLLTFFSFSLLEKYSIINCNICSVFLGTEPAYSSTSEKEADGKIDKTINKEQLVIYGRNGCGVTRRYLEELGLFGVQYLYKDISSRAIYNEFWNIMNDQNSLNSIDLPVIIFNNQKLIRPNLVKFIKDNFPEKIKVPPMSKPIVIYSMKNDNITKSFLNELDQCEIKYTFKDINDPETNRLFFNKAREMGLGNSVHVPAVDINGKIHIGINLAKLISLLNNR